jgi:hypothetical protein
MAEELPKKKKQTSTVKEEPKKLAPNKLELLITIINKDKAEFYADLIQSFEVNMQMMVLAEGTASLDIRTKLGLVDNEKVVIFSVVQQNKISDILYTLSTKFNTIKNGKGIAYTIPMTSVIGVAIYSFLSNNTKAVEGK